MQPDSLAHPGYFDSPARTERLQLLQYLARNAIEPVYLRAPTGAGKTRLIERLHEQLEADLAIVRLDLSEPVKPIAGILQQLGLPPEAADEWPQQLMAGLGDRPLLVIVDAADALDASYLKVLAPLSQAGERLLLVGQGGGAGDLQVQYVDLPPFTAEESATFLRAAARGSVGAVTDELANKAHALADGWPGRLLEALSSLVAAGPSGSEAPGQAARPPVEPEPVQAAHEQPEPEQPEPDQPAPRRPEPFSLEPLPSEVEQPQTRSPQPATYEPAPREPASPEPAPGAFAPAEPEPAGREPLGLRSEPAQSGDAVTDPVPTRPERPAYAPPPRPAKARAASGKPGSKAWRGPQPVDADKVLRAHIASPWAWAGAAVVGLVLIGVLVFQDSINSLVAPADNATAPVAVVTPPVSPPVAALPAPEPALQPPAGAPPVTGPERGSSEMAEAAATSGLPNDTGDVDTAGSQTAPVTGDPATESPASPNATADADRGDDLLDAVMQDALAAQRNAIEETEPEPPAAVASTPPKPVSEPQPRPAADAVAVVGQPTPPTPVVVEAPAAAAAPIGTDSAPVPQPAVAAPEVVAPTPATTPRSGAAVTSAGVTPDRRDLAEPANAPAPVEERRIAAVAPKESGPAAVASPTPRSASVAPAADGGPAPVEDRTPLAAAPQPSRPAAAPPQTGEPWLNTRAPDRYTLQLVGARDRAAIEKFVQDHGISAPFAVFERQLNGAAWYSLVAGDYPNRDAAVAARDRLPAALAGAGVWPRTFESILTTR